MTTSYDTGIQLNEHSDSLCQNISMQKVDRLRQTTCNSKFLTMSFCTSLTKLGKTMFITTTSISRGKITELIGSIIFKYIWVLFEVELFI